MPPSKPAVQLSDLPLVLEAVIPEEYLDEMGHMNVMWYTHLFSQASGAFFDLFGMGLSYMTESDAGSFALEAHVHYHREVRAGQRVKVYSRLISRSSRLLHYQHFMGHEDNALAATCEFVSAHMDMKHRRMAAFPNAVAHQIDELLEKHQKLEWPAPVCGVIRP